MHYIKSPAIQFRLPPENTIHMVEDYCHQACYDYIRNAYEIYAQTYPDKYNVIEGFTLTDGSFVDRFEAMIIAKEMHQVGNTYHDRKQLESYMIVKYGGPYI